MVSGGGGEDVDMITGKKLVFREIVAPEETGQMSHPLFYEVITRHGHRKSP